MQQTLSHINLMLAGKTIILVFLVFLGVAFSLFIYRRTNPVVSRFTKAVLVTLRISVLFFLLLILFEATLQFQFNRSVPPSLAIAVDHSASMKITDNSGSRPQTVQTILTSTPFKNLKSNFDMPVFIFSADASAFTNQDSIVFNGDLTNISASLKSIKQELVQQNPAGILLLTDGNYNAGVNPLRAAEELGIPIYPVGIGSADPVADLAIMDIEANLFAYTGEPTPLKIKLRNIGLPPVSVPVTLKSDGAVINTKTVSLPAGPAEITTEMLYTPAGEGRKKLAVSVPVQAQEQTKDNNQRTVYMNVLKARLNVLVLAGLVSPDVSFLRRILSANQRFNTIMAVERKDGSFYSNPEILQQLEKVDFFILYSYPTPNSNIQILQQMGQALLQNAKPVLFLAGQTTDYSKLTPIEDYIPLRSTNKPAPESQIYIKPVENEIMHPVLQTGLSGQSVWAILPPVFTNLTTVRYWPNSHTLINGVFSPANAGQIPVLLIRTNGPHQSAAITSYGNWRLDFLMSGIQEQARIYTNIINNLGRWLESTHSQKRVNLETNKRIYHFGEAVQAQVRVFDENRNPITDANVQIELRGRGKKYFTPDPGRNGYTSEIFPQLPGEYMLTATAQKGPRVLGSDTLQISIGDYSAELAEIPLNKPLLQGIARAGNGFYISPDSLGRLAKIVPGRRLQSTVFRENELWNEEILLILVVLLLAAEWFIRKKKGMV